MSLTTRAPRTPSQPRLRNLVLLMALVVQNSGTRPINLRRTWDTFQRWDNFTIGNLSRLKHSRENDLLREPRWDGTLRPKGIQRSQHGIGKIFLNDEGLGRAPFGSDFGELPSGLSLRVEDSRAEPQGRRQSGRASGSKTVGPWLGGFKNPVRTLSLTGRGRRRPDLTRRGRKKDLLVVRILFHYREKRITSSLGKRMTSPFVDSGLAIGS
jgi:hypothetical protein